MTDCRFFTDLLWSAIPEASHGLEDLSLVWFTCKSQLGKGKWHGLRSTRPAFQLQMFCEEEVPGVFSRSVSSENEAEAVNTDQKWKRSCNSIHRRSKSQGKQFQRVKKREGKTEGGQERAKDEETTSLDIWQWGRNANSQIKMCRLQLRWKIGYKAINHFWAGQGIA